MTNRDTKLYLRELTGVMEMLWVSRYTHLSKLIKEYTWTCVFYSMKTTPKLTNKTKQNKLGPKPSQLQAATSKVIRTVTQYAKIFSPAVIGDLTLRLPV